MIELPIPPKFLPADVEVTRGPDKLYAYSQDDKTYSETYYTDGRKESYITAYDVDDSGKLYISYNI